MSNRIRYDSVLVRYLAEELDERVRGRPIEGLSYDPDALVAAIILEDGALVLRLHPAEGAILFGPAPHLPVEAPLPRHAIIRNVSAPLDERILTFTLDAPRFRPGRARRIVVELMGNQWNVIAVDRADRIVAVLRRRSGGPRPLVAGAAYAPPPPASRAGTEAPLTASQWRSLLGSVDPPDRIRTIVATVAYTSPLNAASILGEAADEAAAQALDAAYERYRALASLPPVEPCVIRTERGPLPYPLPLPGLEHVRYATLLEAIAAASGAEAPPPVPAVAHGLLDRLRARMARIERRRRRLADQLAGAGEEAARARRQADLLLGQLHRVRKGLTTVELDDFEGGAIQITLDPALTPSENAERLYETARRRRRAAERLPGMIERIDNDYERLGRLLERAMRGEATGEHIEAEIGPREESGRRSGARPETTVPYRRFRTSGGLEVRVGRGRKANDDLTFHHSSPNDVWLHARDAAGAHVILRWNDPRGNPPARDLAEAAVLAAVHSRARTSGVVAVDWTRRKYVRKPRKAPPGLVVLERSTTVFVEPDEALAKQLRS